MITYYPFRPALQGVFLERFHTVVRQLCLSANPATEIPAVALEEYRWASNSIQINPQQRRVYRAIWLLLRDLLRARWICRWRHAVLEVAPPPEDRTPRSTEELNAAKASAREVLVDARREKLIEAREFIERMENPPVQGLARVPVDALIGNGAVLAAHLRRIAALRGRDRQIASLRESVRPYLQLVQENERCTHTGHKLADIWRYFRLTWTTPAENTPGRTLLYLVRDAAQPFHPVVGIASLENSPLRIAARDHYLGWSSDAFLRQVEEADTAEEARGHVDRLLLHIQTAIADIRTDDLCTLDECARPTRALLQRLALTASRSIVERKAALRAWSARADDELDDEAPSSERSELSNISVAAEEALYRRKRAEQLSRLLTSRQVLEGLANAEDFKTSYKTAFRSEKAQSAIWSALVAVKNRHIGTSILELNVCGAIPPYNELLGGKLTALLMLSPRVVADYRERYGGRPSDIASRLKGEPVVRPADLVYIGTTSLYRAGSSQYNRLGLPSGVLGQRAHAVKWKEIGATTGYGTLHISRLALR